MARKYSADDPVSLISTDGEMALMLVSGLRSVYLHSVSASAVLHSQLKINDRRNSTPNSKIKTPNAIAW
jgi:hypothetical protein